jgi:hypothetical protein
MTDIIIHKLPQYGKKIAVTHVALCSAIHCDFTGEYLPTLVGKWVKGRHIDNKLPLGDN